MTDHPAAIAPPAGPAAARISAPRLESVDLLRGLIMVVMALDHVRDFFHFGAIQGAEPLDLVRTTAPIFLTRWITHFCAPLFSFLAGAGACFAVARGKPKPDLSWFLVTRGLWLIFLELTVFMWFGWKFDFTPHHYVFATLWSLGWSMILLAVVLHLPLRVMGWGSLTLIVLINATDHVEPASWGACAWLWQVLHAGGNLEFGNFRVWVFYPLLPWPAVMAAGYAFGTLYQRDPAGRRRRLLQLGLGCIAAFVLLRWSNLYGDPSRWATQHSPLFTVLSFIDCAKYPPSLLYLLMTLGLAFLFLAWFESGTPWLLRPILVYGRVPMFYYLLHIPLIHGLAWIWAMIKYGRADFLLIPVNPPPAGAGFGLLGVYAIWAAVVISLYPACCWFADLKRRRRDAWLSYL